MARLPARCILYQNPLPTSSDEFASSAPIEGSDTYTLAPILSRAPTPALPATPALVLAAVNLTIRYSKADF